MKHFTATELNPSNLKLRFCGMIANSFLNKFEEGSFIWFRNKKILNFEVNSSFLKKRIKQLQGDFLKHTPT